VARNAEEAARSTEEAAQTEEAAARTAVVSLATRKGEAVGPPGSPMQPVVARARKRWWRRQGGGVLRHHGRELDDVL
jgi:hypothetical protein